MILDQNPYDKACRVLIEGGVIAYPTEAVWGLGCDPFNEVAVSRILTMKKRPVCKGLILVASSISQLKALLKPLSPDKVSQLNSSWPSATTWLIQDYNDVIPPWIKGEFSSVAVRVSQHPTIRKLCNHYGGPIVSTSLNPAGEVPANTSLESRGYFNDSIDFIVEGSVGDALSPSRIICLDSNAVIRAG